MSPRPSAASTPAAWGTETRREAARSTLRPERRPFAWILLTPAGGRLPSLVLDEWGLLWWARVEGRMACLLRSCSRDEAVEHVQSVPAEIRWLLTEVAEG